MLMDWDFAPDEGFCVPRQHGRVCAVCDVCNDVVSDDVDVTRDVAAGECVGAQD